MGPAKKKKRPAARVMPSRVSKMRGVDNLRKAVREENKRLSYDDTNAEPKERKFNIEPEDSLWTRSFWSKKKVRRLLPEANLKLLKPTFPTKKLCSLAVALCVTPEMVRCGAIKAMKRKMIDDRPLGCGDTPPVITLDDYVARRFGGEMEFWMELSVRKVMNDLSLGIVNQRDATQILGVSSATLQIKLRAFKELNESVIDEEPDRDSDGDIVCDDRRAACISDYDVIRMKNIKEKTEMFKSLGLDVAKSAARRKRGFTWRTIHMKPGEAGTLKKLSKNDLPTRVMPQRETKLKSAFTMKELNNGGNSVRVGEIASRSYPLPAADDMPLDEFITLDSDYLKTRHGLRWLSVKTSEKDNMKTPYSLDYPGKTIWIFVSYHSRLQIHSHYRWSDDEEEYKAVQIAPHGLLHI